MSITATSSAVHKKSAPWWAHTLYGVSGSLTENFLGGPKHLKMAWVINFHKFITVFLIYGMMNYYDNFSTAAWIYLGMHGVYGYCWLIKDFGFRDGSFETRVTYPGAIMTYVMLVAWYWVIPWIFISSHTIPLNEMLALAIAIHTLGITWMIAADCQKHFSLKYNRGLITEGVFKYTRNPNFLGEIMIYGSYALLANQLPAYLVFGYGTIFFLSRMYVKDASISRYPEWPEYSKQSSMLIPWKIFRLSE